MSNKDRVLAIVAPGILLTSAISVIAQNWTLTSAPITNWTCVASSADGNRLVAVYSSGIYTSTNSGATWDFKPAFPQVLAFRRFFRRWRQIGCSCEWRLILHLTNAGATWVTNGAPSKDWVSVASSADGNKLVAVANSGTIYTSTNGRGTWVSKQCAETDCGIRRFFADGRKLAAVGVGFQTAA